MISNSHPEKEMDTMIGAFVLIRSVESGVHAGYLSTVNTVERCVVLHQARRLWSWHAKRGVSLTDGAVYGFDEGDGRVITSVAIDRLMIMGVCEVLVCSDEAKTSIEVLQEKKIETISSKT